MQLDGSIVPYITTHGDEILLQRKDKISVDQMFHLEHVHNYWRTWAIRFDVLYYLQYNLKNDNNKNKNKLYRILSVNLKTSFFIFRGLGWLVLFLAATCLANIIRTLVLNSNFLRGVIAVESVNISVSMSISLLVIGFAWVWYRPIIGLCLALASIVPFLYSTVFSGHRGQQRDNYRRL